MEGVRWFRMRAKELYHRDGEIEVDDNARVSLGDDRGAYVEAWVWVPKGENKKARNFDPVNPCREIPPKRP